MSTERHVYTSAAALLAAAGAEPSHDYGRERRKEHCGRIANSTRGRDSFRPRGWYGDGVERLADGFAAAASGVHRTFTGAATQAVTQTIAPAVRPRVTYRVAGGAVNVPRMLSGRPECMRRIVRAPGLGPVVRVRFGTSTPWTVSGKAIEHRGRCILGAVDSLARAGRRVELWAVHHSTDRDGANSVAEVCIKHAGQPLDWQRAAFWTCHPAAQRIVLFAWEDAALSESTRTALGSNRGCTAPLRELPGDWDLTVESPENNAEAFALTADSLAAEAMKSKAS